MAHIMQTSRGPIDIEVIGSGCPVLILHGSPGGIDAARAMCKFLPKDQFKSILVSRPGYLNTPLDHGHHSIDDEADLLAAALDAMNMQQTCVVAWSGGGPPAYRLAVRHPDRVLGLVSIAAVSFRWIEPKPDFIKHLLFGTSIGNRLVGFLAKHRPQEIIGGALEGEGSVRGAALKQQVEQAMADPDQRDLILEISKTVNNSGNRKAGWDNDVANYSKIQSLELEKIKCPVLLMHGDSDTDADVEHSQFAHRQIPGSEFVEMKEGTHLCFYAHPDAKVVQAKTREWLLRASATTRSSRPQ